MEVEIIEFLSPGSSNIHHIRSDKTEVINVEKKGELKWNAILDYVNTYCSRNNFDIEEIESGKIWLVNEN